MTLWAPGTRRAAAFMANSNRRVVITGVGLVTALGNSNAGTWNGIVAGKSGAANITAFDISAYPTRFGCEVRNFEASEFMDLKDSKRTDRTVHLAMCAACLLYTSPSPRDS